MRLDLTTQRSKDVISTFKVTKRCQAFERGRELPSLWRHPTTGVLVILVLQEVPPLAFPLPAALVVLGLLCALLTSLCPWGDLRHTL